MKITVLSNQDLASCVALNLLLPDLDAHEVTVLVSPRHGGTAARPAELERLGWAERDVWVDEVFPRVDAGEVAAGALRTFEGLGRRVGRPVETLDRPNASAGLALLAASEPDLVLSVRYGRILKDRAIAIPRLGVLNLHSGPLPAYRGVMATFWAMLHGAPTIGTTLHRIEDAGIDEGSIVATTERPVDPSRSYLWNVLQLYPEGCQAMAEAVASLARGEALTTRPQIGEGAYFTFPDADALARFAGRGLRLWDDQDLDALRARFVGA